ncbi:SIR2 family NAD-dependent protein deacylase [Luteimonas sp. e5]
MNLVVLSGAGMSAESGIATFRDALTSLWARFDPAELACEEGFRRDPALVWGWYRWRAAQLMACEPNAGHRGIAALEQAGHAVTVVTQNVDDLHERAGSSRVIHLHGRLLKSRCIDCGAEQTPDPILAAPPVPLDAGRREPPPACVHCGGMFRPGVVWFGEALPAADWQQALAAIESCDLAVVIGTSGLVQPAASLPAFARQCGVRTIEINPQASALSRKVDEHWPLPASAGVARLRQMLAD